MQEIIDFFVDLFTTPLVIFNDLLLWIFKILFVFLFVYAAWFFISTPIKYLFLWIKKLLSGKDDESDK